jgi:putative membrane protein insertion efficiency factor
LVLAPVFMYRRVLSPLKRTPSCRYLPTCSEYAIEAVQQRGVVVGIGLAVARVLRCNPLFHGGFHPVSPRGPADACRAHVHEGQV